MLSMEIVLGAVRHLMTALGVFVVAGGWAEADGYQTFAAEFLGVLGFAWSVWRKVARKARGA